MTQMKAGLFHAHGGPEQVKVELVDVPTIKPDEVLIQVESCTLNRLDVTVRRGMPTLKVPLPHISGSDFVGTVTEVGADVTNLQPKQRVIINAAWFCGACAACLAGEQSLCEQFHMIGEHVWGGLAEYAAVPARNCYVIPDDADAVQTGAMGLTALTAWRMLASKAEVKPGQTVLIIGGGGGLSAAAIQISRHLGATVIVTTSSKAKEAWVTDLGADTVINYKTNAEWGKEVWQLTNKKGVDVVFESVGQATWEQGLRCLKKGGILVTAGATSGFAGTTNIGLIFWKQLRIMGSTMANRQEFEQAMQLILNGTIKPAIDKVFTLDELQEAHHYMDDPNRMGKVVIRIR